MLRKGKVVNHHFMLSGDEIPTVSEQPVKSLGRLYTEDLKDTNRVKELHDDLDDWLTRIDKCGLPNRFKLWCLKFGLMPRLMWRLMIYEVAISHVEAMEMRISSQIRRWLGVPRSLTNIAFYGHTTKLQLPLTSLVEEFKVTKARLVMTLRDSQDPVIKNVAPEVKTGKKWIAQQEVDTIESRLRHKDIVGATQTDRAGLGTREFRYFYKASDKEKRVLVSEEIRVKEEELRHAKAAGLALQGGWIRWESVEPRALTWSNIWSMEPMLFRFTIRATYDVLPSPTNLSIWGLSNDNKCITCQQRGSHPMCMP